MIRLQEFRWAELLAQPTARRFRPARMAMRISR